MSEAGPPTYRLEDLKQRWEKNPNSRLYLQLAEEYRRLERLDEAVQVLEEGLERRPGDLSARVALGRYSLEMGDTERAEEALAAAVERDPTHLVANKTLLEVYLLREDAEKAGERLEIYRLLNDRDPELEHLEFRLHSLRESPEEQAPAPSAAEAELEELISSAGISTTPQASPEDSPEEVAEASSGEALLADAGSSVGGDLEATHPTLESAAVADEPAAPPSLSEGSLSTAGDEMTEKKTESKAGDLFTLEGPVNDVPGFDSFWNDLSGDTATPAVASEPAAPEPAIPEPAVLESATLEPAAPEPPVTGDAFESFEVGFAEVEEDPAAEEEADRQVADAGAVYESVAESTALAVEDAADEGRSIETLATTAEDVAIAEMEEASYEATEAGQAILAHEAGEQERLEDPVLETPEPEPLAFEPPTLEAPEATPSAPETPDLEAAGVESVEMESIEVEPVEVGPIEVEPIEVEPVEALAVESEAIEAEAVELEAAPEPTPQETPVVAPPQATAEELLQPVPVTEDEASPEVETSPEPSAPTEAPAVAVAEEGGAAEEEVAKVTLGSLYLKQGHVEEARRIFEKVLESDPKNHAALAGLGLTRKGEKTGLTAMDLLAGRSMAGTIPAGVTAKKMLILTNYLKHLKHARERNHVR